ncbi:MAG: hypothetical protein QM783_00545 [Phycisphaerales bacterium]
MVHEDEGLPMFDVRQHDALFNGAAAVLARSAAAKGDAAAERLRATIPMMAVDFDDVLGTPVFVRSTAGFLTGQQPGAAWTKVLGEFVAANRALMGFDASELTNNKVTRDFVMAHNGVRHITVQQTHAGVDIFEATLRIGHGARRAGERVEPAA